MVYSAQLESMWFNFFGNSATPNFIGVLAILALFAYLSFKRKLGLAETFIVVFPVAMAYTISGYLPQYLSGMVIIGIGFLWGYALSKVIPNAEGFAKAYIIIVCATAAVGFFPTIFDATCYSANTINPINASDTINGGGQGDLWYSSTLNMIQKLAGFLTGNVVSSFFSCSFPPSLSTLGNFLGYVIQAGMAMLFLQVLALAIPILGNWKAALTVGIGAGLLSYIGVI